MKKKKWLKRKGCKNCALVWQKWSHNEDCGPDCKVEHGQWLIQPYHPGKEFRYISRPFNTQSQILHNIYPTKDGTLKFINKE